MRKKCGVVHESPPSMPYISFGPEPKISELEKWKRPMRGASLSPRARDDTFWKIQGSPSEVANKVLFQKRSSFLARICQNGALKNFRNCETLFSFFVGKSSSFLPSHFCGLLGNRFFLPPPSSIHPTTDSLPPIDFLAYRAPQLEMGE